MVKNRKDWVPERQEVIWIDCNPQRGREMQDIHPFLVLSPSAFNERTGCPILVNTSFNVRGEPIVCRPEEALRCFISTEMDALVLENCVIRKDRLGPDALEAAMAAREKYLSQFDLD